VGSEFRILKIYSLHVESVIVDEPEYAVLAVNNYYALVFVFSDLIRTWFFSSLFFPVNILIVSTIDAALMVTFLSVLLKPILNIN